MPSGVCFALDGAWRRRRGASTRALNEGMAQLRSRLSSPRMRGSSTPQPIDSITVVSGILDRPLSRTMTVESVAQFHDLAARFARGLLSSFLTLRSEGAGNAGCPLHPRPRVHLVVVERTRVTTSTPESPGIPRAMVLRFPSCSPRRSGSFATVTGGIASTGLTPASRCQDHTTSPSALASPVSRAAASTAAHPYVRDVRETSLRVERDVMDID
jgi:hypothetical protein